MKKIFIFIVLINTLIPAVMNSFDFLNIGTGGESTAMGKTSAAAINNIEGLFYNPATIASIENSMIISGSINPYMGMSLWNGAFFKKLSDKLKLALGGTGLSYGDIIGDVSYNGDPGRLLSTGDFLLNASLGFSIGSEYVHLYLGATGKYARESLDGLNLSGLLFDFGSILSFNMALSKLTFGLAYKNPGIDLSGVKQDIVLPQIFLIGTGFYVNTGGAFSFKLLFDYKLMINEESEIRTGLEFGIINTLFLRAGYISGKNEVNNITFGGGIKLNMRNMNIKLDYSFLPMSDLGNQQNIQISLIFGKSSSYKKRAELNKKKKLITKYLSQATSFIENNDYNSALLPLMKVIKLDVSNSIALSNIDTSTMALFKEKKKNAKETAKTLRGLFKQGFNYFKQKRYEDSLKSFNAYIMKSEFKDNAEYFIKIIKAKKRIKAYGQISTDNERYQEFVTDRDILINVYKNNYIKGLKAILKIFEISPFERTAIKYLKIIMNGNVSEKIYNKLGDKLFKKGTFFLSSNLDFSYGYFRIIKNLLPNYKSDEIKSLINKVSPTDYPIYID